MQSMATAVAVAIATVILLLLAPHPAAADRYYNFTIENLMAHDMLFKCADRHTPTLAVRSSAKLQHYYRTTDSAKKMICEWDYAGNTMAGVPVWDEEWPEAATCLTPDSTRGCRVVFEREVMSVVSGTGGTRVLGDVAVKDCGKGLLPWGWLPFGLGCYPKHDHQYVGTIVS